MFTGIHTADITFNLAFATVKELDVQFFYYYQPEEFASALQSLAAGEVNWKAMCTAKVGIDGVPKAFDVLMEPNEYIKVIIEPWRNGDLEVQHYTARGMERLFRLQRGVYVGLGF